MHHSSPRSRIHIPLASSVNNTSLLARPGILPSPGPGIHFQPMSCKLPRISTSVLKQQTYTSHSELFSHFNRTPTSSLHSLRLGIKELTYKFSGSAAGLFGDSFPFLGVDSIEGHNRELGKGFPTTGPRIEAGNVVIHRGLHVTRPLVVACVLSGVRSCFRIDPDAGCSVRGSHWPRHLSRSLVGEGRCLNLLSDWQSLWRSCNMNVVECALRICASFGSTRLIRASFGSTRLICASFGSTRLMCASFGSTRLICASFGSTRLICAFYGTTRLLCRVRAQRGADPREAGRTRKGHMDASGFLIASADVFC
ncbi:hypothetical protein E5676_scaffold767G00250 [Cucumis melo var. makuwa]|uniref:DNA-directed RNA polymerase I subunit RPA1-like n=1 Tax=Cucumis melo var. makuwa TaxID=1194695 RepID=A0A5D3B9C6_CUCMM|nr:hypothetical protein E6C27_scaffold744G001360 [Cucumis melo var. makuwa]TYJ95534.1 hypothetical protein E5676_scaffold767G00250 [Cucumis melo var. makuwa]